VKSALVYHCVWLLAPYGCCFRCWIEDGLRIN